MPKLVFQRPRPLEHKTANVPTKHHDTVVRTIDHGILLSDHSTDAMVAASYLIWQVSSRLQFASFAILDC